MKRFLILFLAAVSVLPVNSIAARGAIRQFTDHYKDSNKIRVIEVCLPSDIQFKNNYFRNYVSAYISCWNQRLGVEIFALTNATTPDDLRLLAIFKASKLVSIKDEDEIAQADVVREEDLQTSIGELMSANTDATEAAIKDLKLLRKQQVH